MYRLVRKVSLATSNEKELEDVKDVNDWLRDGWEVKHIETFILLDKILITQLLLYKKDNEVLTNTKTETETGTAIKNIPTYGQIYGDER